MTDRNIIVICPLFLQSSRLTSLSSQNLRLNIYTAQGEVHNVHLCHSGGQTKWTDFVQKSVTKLVPLLNVLSRSKFRKMRASWLKVMHMQPQDPHLRHPSHVAPFTCQSVFEVLGGKHQCSNLKDEIVLIPEQ